MELKQMLHQVFSDVQTLRITNCEFNLDETTLTGTIEFLRDTLLFDEHTHSYSSLLFTIRKSYHAEAFNLEFSTIDAKPMYSITGDMLQHVKMLQPFTISERFIINMLYIYDMYHNHHDVSDTLQQTFLFSRTIPKNLPHHITRFEVGEYNKAPRDGSIFKATVYEYEYHPLRQEYIKKQYILESRGVGEMMVSSLVVVAEDGSCSYTQIMQHASHPEACYYKTGINPNLIQMLYFAPFVENHVFSKYFMF